MSSRSILYVNQTHQVSGAERSLLELLSGLPAEIEPQVACPHGELFDRVRALGIQAHPIAPTDMSFRVHPVHTARGVSWIGRAALAIKRIAHRTGAELIHANTTRAGLAAACAARLGAPPAIVHVRDWVPGGLLATATLLAIDLGADAVIANSRFIASELRTPPRCPVWVVHNPVSCVGFDPAGIDHSEARSRLQLAAQDVVISLVGQITPWKGQDDAIRILAGVRETYPTAKLLLAGSAKFAAKSTRFDNLAFEASLHDLARELDVAESTLFLGERSDVAEILKASDLVLVPSWKEAFGRIAVEAMCMEIPVVAADVGGLAEIVRDGVDGRLLPPRRPQLWAREISELLRADEVRGRMGSSARARALADFSVERHVERIVAVYDAVLAQAHGGS